MRNAQYEMRNAKYNKLQIAFAFINLFIQVHVVASIAKG